MSELISGKEALIALANLAPYHENEMLFIIPKDALDEVKVLVKKSSTENKDLK